MWARRLLPLLVLLLLPPLIAGCGGKDAVSHAAGALGKRLTVYSSLPLRGPGSASAEQVLAGERLALREVHSHVGPFGVRLRSLDDSGPRGTCEPCVPATNAKIATKAPRTIAYIGDFSSAATAVSLPVTNQAGILQVSPRSPYVGLTSSFDAGQGDPERFFQTGKRTFVRLLPGDPVEGAAEVALMQKLGIGSVYVLGDGSWTSAPLASIIADDAKRAGVLVSGEAVVEVAKATAETSFANQIESIVETSTQAVFFSGQPGPGAAAFWQQLHAADPGLVLLGSSTMAEPKFTSMIGAAASMTYLTTPVLPPTRYGPKARRVLARFRKLHPDRPTSYVLYGYEAMGLVLAAIRAAGANGDEREAVIRAALAIRDRDSVVGRYSVLGNGETTITRYGVDRIRGGMPAFWRELSVNGAEPFAQHVP